MASDQKKNLITVLAASSNPVSAQLNMAPRSHQLIAHIVAANVNAATTIAAKIQHSPDKIHWYDYITFTNIVGAAGFQALPTTSRDLAVFAYVQAVVVLTGATKLADITVDIWYENI
jgi:hypothetical protein